MKKKIEKIKDLNDVVINWAEEFVPEYIAVYGFGSVFDLNFDLNKSGDVDIAILLPSPINSLERYYAQEELARRLGKDVDVIDLLSASTVMKMEVINNSMIISCKDKRATEFFATYVFSSYVRLNEERSEILKDAIARGRIYA